jgi:hypothetical protein
VSDVPRSEAAVCHAFRSKTRDDHLASALNASDLLLVKQKLSSLVDSVTNTETIHVCLHDLLPPNIYFRLNPFMSADFVLDEHRPERLEQMLRDTQTYIRQNEFKFLKLAQQLTRLRSPFRRLLDKIKQLLLIYT